MKTLLAAILLTLSSNSDAIPIYSTIPQGLSTAVNGSVVGYQKMQIGRHWTWHGKARKYSYTALYSAAPVPEPSTYGMLLAGLGLVALKVRRKA